MLILHKNSAWCIWNHSLNIWLTNTSISYRNSWFTGRMAGVIYFIKLSFPAQRRSGGRVQQLLTPFWLLFADTVSGIWANQALTRGCPLPHVLVTANTCTARHIHKAWRPQTMPFVFPCSSSGLRLKELGAAWILLPELQEPWAFMPNLALNHQVQINKQEWKCIFPTCWGIAYSYLELSFYFTQ